MTERTRESARRIERGDGRDAATAAHDGALIATADESLLDLVDNLLNRGVMLQGELVLGVADVDLIYARLSLLLCAADRVLPTEPPHPTLSPSGGEGPTPSPRSSGRGLG